MVANFLRLTLASAPALVMCYDIPEEGARHGTILFYHGFGESKDGYVEVLERLADAGFLAIGIDGVGHGERRFPDFVERFPPIEPPNVGNMQLEAAFLSLVRASAQEVPTIIDALFERGWAQHGLVGLAGHSFGGFVTYAACMVDKRIDAAASVVGSPQWNLPWSGSPHLHLEEFFPTALLSQTAGKDTRVLPEFAQKLHQRLTPYYVSAPERLRYIEYPHSTHDLAVHDWQQAWQEVVDWFTLFLHKK